MQGDRNSRLQFGLRGLLLAIALLSVPLGWVAYQLEWIRRRHAFLEQSDIVTYPPVAVDRPLPWSLRLFGESQQFLLDVPQAELDRARALFPEAILNLVYPPRSALEPWRPAEKRGPGRSEAAP